MVGALEWAPEQARIIDSHLAHGQVHYGVLSDQRIQITQSAGIQPACCHASCSRRRQRSIRIPTRAGRKHFTRESN